jgi:hypothetical protein
VKRGGQLTNKAFIFSIAMAAIAIGVTFPHYFGVMEDRARRVRMAALVGVLKLPSTATGYSLAWNDTMSWAMLEEATQRRASIYRQAWPGWVGKRVDALFGAAERGRCAGRVDQVAPLGDDAAKAAGWAWDKINQVAPEWLVIADAEGTVVGLATSGVSRPDVSASLHRRAASRSGWQGFARVPPARLGSVHAVLRDGLACRLGSVSAGAKIPH